MCHRLEKEASLSNPRTRARACKAIPHDASKKDPYLQILLFAAAGRADFSGRISDTSKAHGSCLLSLESVVSRVSFGVRVAQSSHLVSRVV